MSDDAGNSTPGARRADVIFSGPTRVLGVDPGSETTGYGVIETDGRRLLLVEYAGIRAPARFTLRPRVCAVEETFYAVNVKSALKLGHVRGAILVAAARAGLEVAEYSPLEIKSALVGYGRAEKQQVQEMVRLLLGLKEAPNPLDASDALAAAICHINTAATRRRMGMKG